MAGVTIITDAEFETQVVQANDPVLVYFWASWCGPCRLMSPIINGVADAYGDRLSIVKMEVDPNPNAVATCSVEGVPAFVFFRDGQKIDAIEGAMNRQKLEQFLENHLSPAA
jgi:thioredoxin 1